MQNGVKPENILYVNFEDRRFTELSLVLLNKIYDLYLEHLSPGPKPYILLDEVHKIEGWEKFARTMHELGKAKLLFQARIQSSFQAQYLLCLPAGIWTWKFIRWISASF